MSPPVLARGQHLAGLDETAPRMHPTAQPRHPFTQGDRPVALEPIGHQIALPVVEQAQGHRLRAARVVLEEDHRPARRTTALHPHLALGGGRPAELLEHLERGLVHVDQVVSEQHVAHQVGDRLQGPGGTDHPARERLARHEGARAGKDILEAGQRQAIDVLGDEQHRQQIVAGVALG